MDRIDKLPSAWDRLHRRAAKRMLTAERALLENMRLAVADAVTTLSHDLAGAQSRAMAAVAVARAAALLSHRLEQTILSGRQAAREAARAHWRDELDRLRFDLEREGIHAY